MDSNDKCNDCPWQGSEVTKDGLVPMCTLDLNPETCDDEEEFSERS